MRKIIPVASRAVVAGGVAERLLMNFGFFGFVEGLRFFLRFVAL